MKLKLIAASLLAAASFGASAATIYAPAPVIGSSFTNAFIGTITVGGVSDIVGDVFAAKTVDYGFTSFALDNVTFSSATVGSLVDLNPSASGFSFHNVAAGSYNVYASGSLWTNPSSPVHNVAFLGANYEVSAVPEPETYGMLLGGLAVLGFAARRKAKKAA